MTATKRPVGRGTPARRETTRGHGTYARYVADRCRCEECRRANREYENRRRRRKAYGGAWWGWVDAEPARSHVRELMSSRFLGAKDGIGLKRIGKLAGVSHGSLSLLVYGKQGRPPSRRIRAETERRLLSVRPVEANMADGAVVESAPVLRMVEELIAFGVPRSRIAEAIGKRSGLQTIGLRRNTRVESARAVAALHWRLYESAPRFRLACECDPPYDVLDRLERQGDDGGVPWTPHSGWSYPDAHRAMIVAASATGRSAPCVVTLEEAGTFRWYPAPEYAPASATIIRRMERGDWRQAS